MRLLCVRETVLLPGIEIIITSLHILCLVSDTVIFFKFATIPMNTKLFNKLTKKQSKICIKKTGGRNSNSRVALK